MSTTLTIRVDEQTERELADLTAEAGSRNAAVVEAIHEAHRRSVYERIRRESEVLRNDPGYQAEIRAAREDMGAGNAW